MRQRRHPIWAGLVVAATAAATPTSADAAGRKAHDDWPAAKRCAAILDQVVADTEAGAKALGVADPKAAGERFRKTIKRWDEVCAALPPTALRCLETAEPTLGAIGRCGVHEGRKSFADRAWFPMLASELVPWHSHARGAKPVAAAEAAKVIAELVGTWERSDAWAQKSLTIAADGRVTYVEVRTPKGKPPEPAKTQTGKLEVQGPFAVDVVMDNRTRFNWSMLRDGDALLTSNQTATGAYPISPGMAETRFGWNGHFVLGKGLLTEVPRCFLYGPRFEVLDGHCGWEGRGADKRLVLTREPLVSIESGSKSGAYKVSFAVLRGALVPADWANGKGDRWLRKK